MAAEMPAAATMALLQSSKTGRAILDLMRRAGVDTTDAESISKWVGGHREALHDAHTGRPFAPDPALTWYATDLREELGLGDVAAPVRVSNGELATAAVSSPLISELRHLVRGSSGAGAADLVTLAVAAACGFTATADDGSLEPGPNADLLLEPDLGDILTTWQFIFAVALDAAVPGESGTAIVLALYGAPGRTLLAAGLPGPDPAVTRRLLAALERTGAVELAGERVTLLPLAVQAVAMRLEACGVYVPRLTPGAELRPAQILLLAGMSQGQDVTEDVAAELDAWVDRKTPAGAARELLELAAAAEQPLIRAQAIGFVNIRIGDDAEPAWRDALHRPELACYAKKWLTELAEDRDGQPAPAELALTPAEAAWRVADSCSLSALVLGPDSRLGFELTELVGRRMAAHPWLICKAIAESPHPEAGAALAMLARSKDRKMAKAARAAAAR